MPLGEDGLHHPTQELHERVEALRQQFISGEVLTAIATPFLKDETRKLEKVQDRQTRTFQILPLDYLCIGTMAFGDYMAYMHKNPITTPSTVGIDPASIEWNNIFSQLITAFKDVNLVDLDYKSMEANSTWQIFESYLRHTTRYYKDFGKATWLVRRGYLLTMCYRASVIAKILSLGEQGVPSGMTGTTDDNTYFAVILPAVAFHRVFPKAHPSDFKLVVKLKLNGDDTVMSVSPDIIDEYNFFSLQKEIGTLNTIITPAVKDGPPSATVEQEKVQFCKKFILWSDQLRGFVPFVDRHTLLDQLSYARDTTTPGLVQIVNSALRWAFFRGTWRENGQIPRDEPTFAEIRKELVSKLLDRHDFDQTLIVTYDEILYSYEHPRVLEIRSQRWLETIELSPMSYIAKANTASFLSAAHTVINVNRPKVEDEESPCMKPHAGLISLITGGINMMHDITHPTVPQISPPTFTMPTINPATIPYANPYGLFSPPMGPHAKYMTMSTVSTRKGELLHASLDAHSVVTPLDDYNNRMYEAKPEHFQTKEDEMALDFFVFRPQIIEAFDVPATGTIPLPMAEFPMCPFYSTDGNAPNKNTEYRMTTYEWAMRQFLYWHGSQRWRFQLVGPREYTVRFMLSMHYGKVPGATVTFDEAVQSPNVYFTFDSATRSFTIETPDINPIRWKARVDAVTNASPLGYINGIAKLWMITLPSGINVPLTVTPKLFVWLCGGSDTVGHKLFPTPSLYYPLSVGDPHLTARTAEKPKMKTLSARNGLWEMVTGSPAMTPHSLPGAVTSSPGDLSAGTAVESSSEQAVPSQPTAEAIPAAPHHGPESIEIQKLSMKYFLLDTLTIDGANNNQVIAHYKKPFDFLKKQALLMAKSGVYFRGGVRVLLTPTTGSFSGGLVLAAWLPYGTTGSIATLFINNPTRISALNHVEIDLASNTAIEFYMPFCYYRDYFEVEGDDISGELVIFQAHFTKPTTSALPTTLQIQARWEDFETYVPRPIPTCVTEAMEKRLLEHKPPKHVAMSASPALKPHSLNETVSENAPRSLHEQGKRAATVPLKVTKATRETCSFADTFHRPTIKFAVATSLNPGGRGHVSIPLYPADVQVDLGDDRFISVGLGNLFDQMKYFYCAFAGDTIFDVIVRADQKGVIPYVFTYITKDSVPEADQISGLIAQLPIPYESTDYWPARYGVDAPTSANYVVNSELPLTEFFPNGKVCVRVPFLCQTRYTAANREMNADTLLNYQQNNFAILLTYPNTGARDTPVDVNVYVEIYARPAPGARLALFRGLPDFKFDDLRNATDDRINHTGATVLTP
jgi:hypothetical protein